MNRKEILLKITDSILDVLKKTIKNNIKENTLNLDIIELHNELDKLLKNNLLKEKIICEYEKLNSSFIDKIDFYNSLDKKDIYAFKGLLEPNIDKQKSIVSEIANVVQISLKSNKVTQALKILVSLDIFANDLPHISIGEEIGENKYKHKTLIDSPKVDLMFKSFQLMNLSKNIASKINKNKDLSDIKKDIKELFIALNDNSMKENKEEFNMQLFDHPNEPQTYLTNQLNIIVNQHMEMFSDETEYNTKVEYALNVIPKTIVTHKDERFDLLHTYFKCLWNSGLDVSIKKYLTNNALNLLKEDTSLKNKIFINKAINRLNNDNEENPLDLYIYLAKKRFNMSNNILGLPQNNFNNIERNSDLFYDLVKDDVFEKNYHYFLKERNNIKFITDFFNKWAREIKDNRYRAISGYLKEKIINEVDVDFKIIEDLKSTSFCVNIETVSKIAGIDITPELMLRNKSLCGKKDKEYVDIIENEKTYELKFPNINYNFMEIERKSLNKFVWIVIENLINKEKNYDEAFIYLREGYLKNKIKEEDNNVRIKKKI